MKVRHSDWLTRDYVIFYFKTRSEYWYGVRQKIFYFKTRSEYWYGVRQKGDVDFHLGNTTGWEVYKEPLYSITELVEQELDFIPGKLKLINNTTGRIFYPYFLDKDNDWIGHDENKQHAVWNPNAKEWKVWS
jgi:hypothetical protein